MNTLTPATSFVVPGLTNGTTYTFAIAATNSQGTGAESAPTAPVRYVAAADYVPVVPARLLETRSGSATIDGLFNGIGLRAAGSVTELHVTGRAGVPNDATAVVLNVTVTAPTGPGYITVLPCGSPLPNASNLNYLATQTIPNLVIARIGTSGNFCIYTTTATHILADINGYYPV